MAFLLRAASFKAQTAEKERMGCENADMTFTRPFGMGVLDGVSGCFQNQNNFYPSQKNIIRECNTKNLTGGRRDPL